MIHNRLHIHIWAQESPSRRQLQWYFMCPRAGLGEQTPAFSLLLRSMAVVCWEMGHDYMVTTRQWERSTDRRTLVCSQFKNRYENSFRCFFSKQGLSKSSAVRSRISDESSAKREEAQSEKTDGNSGELQSDKAADFSYGRVAGKDSVSLLKTRPVPAHIPSTLSRGSRAPRLTNCWMQIRSKN